MKAKYRFIQKYCIEVELDTPMHTGAGVGKLGEVLKDVISGKPFFQATGIAGSFGDYVEQKYSSEVRKYWFGDSTGDGDNRKSKLTISDGVFNQDNLKLEYRTRLRIDGKTGTVAQENQSGQLTGAEYISAGAKMSFEITEFIPENAKKESVVEDILGALHSGEISLGGSRTTGCGKVHLLKVIKDSFDMMKPEDQKKWIQEGDCSQGENITEFLVENTYDNSICVWAEVSFDTPLMIKQYVVSAQDEEVIESKNNPILRPDCVSFRNGQMQYVIPGSSVKGAVRNHIEKICRQLKVSEAWITNIFENRTDFICYDAELEDVNAKMMARNKINRMLGSIMDGALFFEKPVTGSTVFKFLIPNNSIQTDSEKKLIACLVYTIRDLNLGLLTLGGGSSVGRGFGHVHNLVIQEGNNLKVEIDMDQQQILEGEEFLNQCLVQLKEGKEQ